LGRPEAVAPSRTGSAAALAAVQPASALADPQAASEPPWSNQADSTEAKIGRNSSPADGGGPDGETTGMGPVAADSVSGKSCCGRCGPAFTRSSKPRPGSGASVGRLGSGLLSLDQEPGTREGIQTSSVSKPPLVLRGPDGQASPVPADGHCGAEGQEALGSELEG
jgi:hypothetical protein